jgi:hypothetical protein
VPVVTTTAYGTVEAVLIEARAIVNDMLVSQDGEILTDNAPFTFPMLNRAARYFELELANNGVKTFLKQTTLTPITACNFPNLGLGATDPGQQVNLSDAGYFDGSAVHIPPQLPSDLLVPRTLRERVTGSQERWVDMKMYPEQLPSIVQGLRMRCWTWMTEQIVMPGATQKIDLQLEYEGETAQFATVNDVIMIRGAQSALSSYLAAIFVASLDPMSAAGFAAAGDDFTLKIVKSNVRAAQGKTNTRISYGRAGRG